MIEPEDEELARALMYICLMHRMKHGYGEETPIHKNDCNTLACQQGCPIAAMPDAPTWAELMAAD